MNDPKDSCVMCERVANMLRGDDNSRLIHEFPYSLLVVGDHQYYRGYSVLIAKEHAREMHELDPDLQTLLFIELMTSAKAIAAAFNPWKMNYSCYGNVVPHIHWHLFPRYESDPDRLQVPWFHQSDFDKFQTEPEQAQTVAAEIRANLFS